MIHLIYFTQSGKDLSQTIQEALSTQSIDLRIFCGSSRLLEDGAEKTTLHHFVEGGFHHKKEQKEKVEGLIFVSATGIAVRAIAPFLEHKQNDPAVMVIDDSGRFVISLLSGHLGGANEYTTLLAEKIGAIPVITTATDNHHVFAVDSFAKKQGLRLFHPQGIKKISSSLLHGEEVKLYSTLPIEVKVPNITVTPHKEESDFIISHEVDREKLTLVPQSFVLGIGCRKNTDFQKLSSFLGEVLTTLHIHESAISSIASIDVKQDEPALLQLASQLEIPFQVFSAETLNAIEGEFTASSFVAQQVGVDNVCERSVIASGGETFLLRKTTNPQFSGITVAVGQKKQEVLVLI